MTPSESMLLMESISHQICVVILLSDVNTAEAELQYIQKLGYRAFLRTTAMGTEMVVTDYVGTDHGTVGSTRLEAS